MENSDIIQIGARVINTEANALNSLANSLGADFAKAVHLIFNNKGRVVVSGMGKSGHIGRKITATLASTGTPSFFVHPAEASHGDLGMVTKEDICIIISNSGETSEISDIVAHTRRFAIPMIGIAGKADSSLINSADIGLVLPPEPEACAIGMAPTTSTTMTLALGDALAVAVMEMRGFEKDNFKTFHPGGKLGSALLKVHTLMHSGDELPLVAPNAPMSDVIITMTAKTFGVAGIVEDDKLIGIVTDGDLRRNLDGLLQKTAIEVANKNPKSVAKDSLAVEALGFMNDKKINCLFVLENGAPIGLLTIQDCLRAGVV